ncbi:MAG: sugar phosphate isomerase/epimerase, partial [Acidobacteriales bacterium]
MNRRSLLSTIAAQPPVGLKLGLDTYVVRPFGWKAFELLDYAARVRLDAIQLGSSDLESQDPAYLKKVREHAERLGISIDAAIGGVCPTSSMWVPSNGDPTTYLLLGLRQAHALGSTNLHVYLGGGSERTGPIPLERHIEETVKSLRSVRSQSMDLNVKIAVENHGDLQAWEMKTLVEEAGKEFVGVCLDSGNSVAVIEDPMLTLEMLGPYVLTTHIRDSVVYEVPSGIAYQWVALGDGSIDFQTFFRRYRELCPQASVQLEILTGSPPRLLPYTEPGFWKAYPKARAHEFARFVALAKKGHPFMGSMLIAPRGNTSPAYAAAVREQRRVDVERSFDHASNVLGIGLHR